MLPAWTTHDMSATRAQAPAQPRRLVRPVGKYCYIKPAARDSRKCNVVLRKIHLYLSLSSLDSIYSRLASSNLSLLTTALCKYIERRDVMDQCELPILRAHRGSENIPVWKLPRSANSRNLGPDNAGRKYGPILKAALSAALLRCKLRLWHASGEHTSHSRSKFSSPLHVSDLFLRAGL